MSGSYNGRAFSNAFRSDNPSSNEGNCNGCVRAICASHSPYDQTGPGSYHQQDDYQLDSVGHCYTGRRDSYMYEVDQTVPLLHVTPLVGGPQFITRQQSTTNYHHTEHDRFESAVPAYRGSIVHQPSVAEFPKVGDIPIGGASDRSSCVPSHNVTHDYVIPSHMPTILNLSMKMNVDIGDVSNVSRSYCPNVDTIEPWLHGQPGLRQACQTPDKSTDAVDVFQYPKPDHAKLGPDLKVSKESEVEPHMPPKHYTECNWCRVCGNVYARKSTLKTHMRVHSGEKPYTCSVCRKDFAQASNLSAHLRTHTGEKPFRCSVCSRCFSQSSSLTTHFRTHSGERPYRCHYCRRAFSDSSSLTKHHRTHSGARPYQCQMCCLRFSQSGNLNRHMKVHSRDRNGRNVA